MAGVEFHMDHAAVGAIARSAEVGSLVTAAAHRVAAGVSGARGVYVESYVTDRAGASVTVVDRGAEALERVTGRLANAARGAGLEVVIRG